MPDCLQRISLAKFRLRSLEVGHESSHVLGPNVHLLFYRNLLVAFKLIELQKGTFNSSLIH
jgi:hypothetical protein